MSSKKIFAASLAAVLATGSIAVVSSAETAAATATAVKVLKVTADTTGFDEATGAVKVDDSKKDNGVIGISQPVKGVVAEGVEKPEETGGGYEKPYHLTIITDLEAKADTDATVKEFDFVSGYSYDDKLNLDYNVARATAGDGEGCDGKVKIMLWLDANDYGKTDAITFKYDKKDYTLTINNTTAKAEASLTVADTEIVSASDVTVDGTDITVTIPEGTKAADLKNIKLTLLGKVKIGNQTAAKTKDVVGFDDITAADWAGGKNQIWVYFEPVGDDATTGGTYTLSFTVTYKMADEPVESDDTSSGNDDPASTPDDTNSGNDDPATTVGDEPTNPVTDDETGVEVMLGDDDYDDTLVLEVAGVEDENTDTQEVLDITLKDADGNEVQPAGKVKVSIPVPEKFADAETLYVYHEVDGKLYDCGAKLEDGVLTFTVDHFSKFIISTTKLATADDASGSDQKPTGIALAIAPVVLAAGFVGVAAYTSKKKKG